MLKKLLRDGVKRIIKSFPACERRLIILCRELNQHFHEELTVGFFRSLKVGNLLGLFGRLSQSETIDFVTKASSSLPPEHRGPCRQGVHGDKIVC